MNADITSYIKELPLWQQAIMVTVREIIHKADPNVQETMKWGAPSFEHDGQVVWVFAAQQWVHVSFRQGALLDDPKKLFTEEADTKSKAKRTIKFKEGDSVPEAVLAVMVKQAVANNIVGNKVVFEPAPKEPVELQHDVQTELHSAGLEASFWDRPYYQKKGYVQWIDAAKHHETREKRIAAMLSELREGTYMPPKSDD